MRAKGKKHTYARVVVDLSPPKADPNRVIITEGGNHINYAGEITTRTMDLTTATMLRNSIIITKGEIFAGFYIGDFYLETPMNDYEYMTMPLASLPQHTVLQYDLNKHAHNRQVYLKIW